MVPNTRNKRDMDFDVSIEFNVSIYLSSLPCINRFSRSPVHFNAVSYVNRIPIKP